MTPPCFALVAFVCRRIRHRLWSFLGAVSLLAFLASGRVSLSRTWKEGKMLGLGGAGGRRDGMLGSYRHRDCVVHPAPFLAFVLVLGGVDIV
jgi:hypothetical protein